MNRWIIALGALSMVGSGCSPVVLEPLNGAQGPITPVVSGTTTGGGSSGSLVLAMRGGDVNWQDNFALAATKGPIWTDPETLVLFFSGDDQECANPVLAGRCTGAAPFWQAIIAIPPELDRDAPIDLHDPRINAYSVVTDMDGSLTCGGGGGFGPILSGTVVITGRGTPSPSLSLHGVKRIGGDLDGEYTAQLCGSWPAAAPPTPAYAFHGGDLPPEPGGGPTPPVDSLVVFLGTLPDACTDPWFMVSCTAGARLTFTLPLALQTPGMIDLWDPAISAKYITQASTGGSACAPPAGPLPYGTLEILSSDAGGLTFKIFQSSWDTAPLSSWIGFDGLYSASICP
jgi:hypothetical protein